MFWKKSKKIVDLENRLNDITKEKRELSGKVVILEAQEKEFLQLKRDVCSLRAELARNKREQTEADLFFVSAKICWSFLHGATTNMVQSMLDQQNALRQQLNGIQQPSSFGFNSSLASILGSNPFLRGMSTAQGLL